MSGPLSGSSIPPPIQEKGEREREREEREMKERDSTSGGHLMITTDNKDH